LPYPETYILTCFIPILPVKRIIVPLFFSLFYAFSDPFQKITQGGALTFSFNRFKVDLMTAFRSDFSNI
jgi:hypothetical protein